MNGSDKKAIDNLTRQFFSIFTNRDGAVPGFGIINDLFIPEGLIVKAFGPSPEVCSLDDFIEPRRVMLTDGTLTDFAEEETDEVTRILGNVAQRLSLYRKSGVRVEGPFEARGVKAFQFVRTPDGWRISSVAWDDERDGFAIPAEIGGS